MSTFKKLLALTLALAMVLSVSAFAGSYKADTYKDAASINEDCENAVELMYALDIMTGDTNGNFRPEATITRAEIAKMIYVILNYGNDDEAVNYKGAKFFTDVPAGAWYEGYVNYMRTFKLAEGRGNGTFGPNDPVTTAEAAKMLLTAIGYSAEARQYTGANWAQNVLADASIIGLLKGYNYSTTGYAPRQWVAVMFTNALTKAYTFNTMVPSFNGLLVSGTADVEKYDTLGGKYYGLTEFTGYLYATDSAYVDRIVATRNDDDTVATYVDLQTKAGDQAMPASGYVTFANGKDGAANSLTIKTSQMSVYDLGQQFRVIYDKSDKTVYSIASTGVSETGECMIKDMEGKNDHGNYDNDKDNDYVFTVGEFEGWFNNGSVKVAELASNGNFKNQTMAAKTVYDNLGNADFIRTDLVKSVDRDGNGSIDYIIYTAYDYGTVASLKNNKYHGDYITVKKLLTGDYLTYDGSDTKLYLDEVIISDDEIVEDDFVKYTWNYDEGCYELEVLVPEKATYEGRTSGAVYTFSGSKYLISAKGDAASKITGRKDSEWNIVTDDNLLVTAYKDSTAMSLEALNGKLALVIGVTERYDSGRFYSDRCAIRVLTVAGGNEPIDLVYDVDVTKELDEDGEPVYAGTKTVTWRDIQGWYIPEGAEEADLTKYSTKMAGKPAQLFILHTDEDTEEVWLEMLPADGIIANTKDSLKHVEDDSERALDVEEGTIGVKDVVTENTFFVGSLNSAGTKVTYKVMTLDELGAATIGVKHSEFIYKDLAVDSIRGGYVLYQGANLNGDGATGYAWITSEIDVVGYYNDEYADLLLSDGTPVEYAPIVAATGTTLVEGGLYAYEWDLDSECYVLTAIDWNSGNSNLLKEENFDGAASEIARVTAKKITWKLWNAPAETSDDMYFVTKDVEDYPVALRVDLYERNGSNEVLQDVVTKLYFVSAADLADGLVTIDTEEEGEIVVSVVNNTTISNTFNAKSNSGLIETEDAELVSIHVKIVENTKQ